MSELLNYAKQSHQPEWFWGCVFNKSFGHFFHAVTSGSSPFNEWYEFEREEDALEFALRFESQSVIDHFTRATAEDGRERWFHNDDVSSFDEVDGYTVKKGATPASFADLAQAESPF
tara:strand:+ start:1567 stop:1917 length:351 start_codon:yes stop_codon:yes gene_type:complete